MKKLVNDYENYEIYDNGDVLNLTTKKILVGSIGEGGYKYYRLSKDGKKKMFYAHRLVAEAFIPNPTNLPIVNHKDGNKLNNDISNLEWASYSDNVKHAHESKLIKQRSAAEYYETDLDNEIWVKAPIPSYSVSNYGRVKNDFTQRILKPSLTGGYLKVRLSEDGNVYDYFLHNLVYELFVGKRNLSKEYVIDHIDGDKLNNVASNLREISLSENVNAAFYEQKTNKACKAVKQFDLNHNFIAEFPSCREAGRILHLDASTISKVCRGVNKTHGGFIFEFSD